MDKANFWSDHQCVELNSEFIEKLKQPLDPEREKLFLGEWRDDQYDESRKSIDNPQVINIVEKHHASKKS